MSKFGFSSTQKLNECHKDLQLIFNTVVRRTDCSILVGQRSMEAQDNAFRKGRSTLKWPDSKHNKLPSLAVDVAPYPIDWADTEKFYFFSGYVMAVADSLGIELRWGGDWDGDGDLHDQNLYDLVHFELV